MKARRAFGDEVRRVLRDEYDVSEMVASIWTTGRHRNIIDREFGFGGGLEAATYAADRIASQELGLRIDRQQEGGSR